MIQAPTAKVLAALATELQELAAGEHDPIRLQHAAALAASLRAQLVAAGGEDPAAAPLARAAELVGADGGTATAAALTQRAAGGDPEARSLLAEVADALLRARGIGLDAGPAPVAEAAVDRPDRATVARYLRGRPGWEDAGVEEVQVLQGGYSKHTVLVRCTAGDIVLRQVLRGRAVGSLPAEFGVLQAAFERGLPVPEPLWIEPEDNALGGPFFVTRRAEGENIGDVWGAAGASPTVALELAAIYARIHTVDTAGLEPPASARASRQDIAAMLDWAHRTAAVRGVDGDPLIAALLAWLRSHTPGPPERSALLHGDAAFSNVLVTGDRISAVLDWEYAHLGNPAEELAYLRPSIEPVLAWEAFLERYVEAGGTAPSAEDLRFFEVWSHVWRHLGCLGLAAQFEKTGRYSSAVAAWVHGPRFLQQAVTAAFGTDGPLEIANTTGGIDADT
jgi:aminoglycoside phosphotransferase (APT) family kinase protein